MPEQDDENERLEALSQRFMRALSLKQEGDVDKAEDELRAVLREEPRLPEPHLELARVLLDTGRLTEAESHAREGLEHLANTGPWTEEIPDNVLEALANALLAEILRRRADEDDVIFGDPAVFHKMVEESKQAFARAAELDPSDEYSSYYAFFLGAEGHGGPVELELAPAEPDRPGDPHDPDDPDPADG